MRISSLKLLVILLIMSMLGLGAGKCNSVKMERKGTVENSTATDNRVASNKPELPAPSTPAETKKPSAPESRRHIQSGRIAPGAKSPTIKSKKEDDKTIASNVPAPEPGPWEEMEGEGKRFVMVYQSLMEGETQPCG